MDNRTDNQLTVIRDFVARHVTGEFAEEDDLFAAGHVNSLFAVQIVMFVERTFEVPVAGDDLDLRNFCSVARIDRFVTDRRAV